METAEWIADAQARCDAATEAPWTPQHPNASESYVYAMDARYPSLPGNPSPVKVAWVPWSPGDERDTNDTAFIAAARQDLPRALDALEGVIEFLQRRRADALRALRACQEATPDYWRWQGHAEVSRQALERLGADVPD